jgi:ATP synthase protein I
MVTIVKVAPETADELVEDSGFVPLTAEEAKQLRAQNPSLSPWWVVLGQVLVGFVLTLATWLVSGRASLAWSVASGAMAVAVPAALFARGVTGKFASANAGSAVLSFFVWELVKILVTVCVMFAAHHWVRDLSWPAMLVGLVVTMKVYWLALGFKRKSALVQS